MLNLINILSLVMSEKKILHETKNHNPSFKLNGRFLTGAKDSIIHVLIKYLILYY